MLTDNQKAIINKAKENDGQITKKEAVELIGGNYYCNAGKHVGYVLTRMIKSGLLERIKIGVYKISSKGKKEQEGEDANQIKLNLT